MLSLIQESSGIQGLLVAANGALVAAMGILYRDCRKDREKLWAEIREINRRVNQKR